LERLDSDAQRHAAWYYFEFELTFQKLLHESIEKEFMSRLISAYQQVKIGDPLVPGTLCGPLHTPEVVKAFRHGMDQVNLQKGRILYGGKVLDGPGNFVQPTITRISPTARVVQREIFVPILHTSTFRFLRDAITYNNSVRQGLSSSLFTRSINNVYEWTGANGSDCGIVNVNIPTNGAGITEL
jgi:aldehyde dehydrogenase family 7 protein A1